VLHTTKHFFSFQEIKQLVLVNNNLAYSTKASYFQNSHSHSCTKYTECLKMQKSEVQGQTLYCTLCCPTTGQCTYSCGQQCKGVPSDANHY